jgi:RecB family exonuclease
MSDLFRLSLSKTKCFNQCKKQYEFNYILKFPKKTRDYHVTGTFCHKVLEDFHQEYIKGCLLPYNIVMGDVYKKAIKKNEKDMTPEMKTVCLVFVDKYIKKISLDKKNGKPFNVLAVEKGFELPIGQDKNIILNGSIDRIQLDPDGVINVADYKTTKNKKS